MVGSAHDGRKKSIMQTLPILPLPYNVMQTLAILPLPLPYFHYPRHTLLCRHTIQCYAESPRSAIQCYTAYSRCSQAQSWGQRRLRGWAIRIASPSGFMGHGYSSPLILALCHLGSGSKSSLLWHGGRWSLPGRCLSWPFSRSGT